MVLNTVLESKLVLSQFEISKELYESGLFARYEMTQGAKLFLVALANHYNPKNPDMYPSQDFLAKKLGVNERTIRRAIVQLGELGLVEYETKKVNHYKFTAKFFAEVKMSYKNGQIVRLNADKMSDKHIHEQKNNNKGGVLKFPSGQPKGIEYPKAEPVVHVRDDRTPENDFETARNFVRKLWDMKDNPVVKARFDKVLAIWGNNILPEGEMLKPVQYDIKTEGQNVRCVNESAGSGQNVRPNQSHYLLW